MKAENGFLMRLLTVVFLATAALWIVGPAGCGSGPRYVPVSGTLKLNGEPYKDAVVTFQPMATGNNVNPGRGSSSYTDENGRFQLKTDDGQSGAVPGKHRIRIMTKGDDMALFDPEKGSPDDLPAGRKMKIDPIPRSWNVDSDKEFEVPATGTDKADFDIITKK
jgi:hypothetical protein